MTIPAKLQSYMACGIPILASASGETERIIREAGCGVVCRIGDAEALAEGILRLKGMPKDELRQKEQRALKYCQEHFNSKILLEQMEKYLRK